MKKLFFPLLLSSCVVCAFAQTDSQRRWHFSVKLGDNIGAATPLSIPVEIREIKAFNPHFNPSAEVAAALRLGTSWSLNMGVRVEQMSMTTCARVKTYSTEIVRDDSHLSGVWTGDVETRFSAAALTVPVSVGLSLGSVTTLRAGFYGSFLMHREFGGNVYEGYLRQGDPTGPKIVFEGDDSASYEFNDDLRQWQWGAMLAADFTICHHILLSAQLSYGFMNIFRSDFKTVSFAMHPIFGNLSVGYTF